LKPFTLVLLLSLLNQTALAAPEKTWELKRDNDGIQIYTKSLTGSKFKAVKAEMELAVPTRELVALVMDTEACPEWAALCKASEIVQQTSETDLHIYTLTQLPWPVKDRDAVTRVVWTLDGSGKVTMSAEFVPGIVPETKKATRLTRGTTAFIFQPLDPAQTRVTSHAHIDPGGATPAWITNMLLVDSPFETMQGIRTLVTSGRYQDAQIEFLESAPATQ
jgi:hypothetical protein